MKRIPHIIETSRPWRIALVLLVSILVTGYFFQTALQHPSGVIYAGAGDGIKNYYTPMWYVAHDSGAVFSGMNYPYTETTVYSDNQPLVSYPLQLLSHHTHISSSKVLAVINLLPIISLIFSCVLVYYLLRRANLPYWYSLFFAVIINFHAPQIMRLTGAHYGLSYVCFVPLIWVCVDGLLQRKWPLLWGIALALISTCFAFLHPYYLPIAFFMAAGYGGIHIMQHRQQLKSYLLRYTVLFIGGILPFLLVKLWMHSYDAVTDRIGVPYGMDVYRASFYSLFIPDYVPHSETAYYHFEGIAYVGWFGLVVLAIMLFKSIAYLRARQFSKLFTPVAPSILQTAPWLGLLFFFLANASLFLVLSHMLPRAFEGLRQFRSVGRFAWVFYYLFSCWSVWLLYVLLRKLRMKGLTQLSQTALFVFCALSAYETYVYLAPVKEKLCHSFQENEAQNFLGKGNNYADWVAKAGFKTTDFQAILPIPFFNMGSEKVGDIYSTSTVYEALKASLSTDLPVITAYTTRASIAQTNKIVQVMANPLIRKTVLKDYPSLTKPLLIVYNKKSLENDDAAILSYATHIFSNEYVELYSLQPRVLDSVYSAAVLMATQQIDSSKVAAPLIFDGFEKHKNREGVNGGSAYAIKEDSGTVATYTLPATLQQDTLIVSCWVKITKHYTGMPQLTYTITGKNGAKSIVSNPSVSHDVYEDWVITHDTLIYAKAGDALTFSVVGKDVILDNFQVRHKNQHAWVKDESHMGMGYYDSYLISTKPVDGNK